MLSLCAYIPLLVEIKTEACEDQGEERHEDGDSDGAAVGGAAGVGIDERYVFPHAQTWGREERYAQSKDTPKKQEFN